LRKNRMRVAGWALAKPTQVTFPLQNLRWARDMLYGSTSPWQQEPHMSAPGLLADRNKTNLFNGVWRIPMDDIDRCDV